MFIASLSTWIERSRIKPAIQSLIILNRCSAAKTACRITSLSSWGIVMYDGGIFLNIETTNSCQLYGISTEHIEHKLCKLFLLFFFENRLYHKVLSDPYRNPGKSCGRFSEIYVSTETFVHYYTCRSSTTRS